MTVVNLSWYTSVVLLLGVLMLSFMSFAPGAESFFNSLLIGFVAGAAVTAMTAMILHRKPSSHWVHTSKPFYMLFVAIATAATLVVALMVIG